MEFIFGIFTGAIITLAIILLIHSVQRINHETQP
jgi:hypothetical protein